MKKLITLILLIFSLAVYSQDFSHKVKSGDTLFGISRQYNVTIQALKEENLVLKNGLQVGQTLHIPARRQIVVGLDSIQSKIIAIELNDCEYTKKELDLAYKVLKEADGKSSVQTQHMKKSDEQVDVVNKLALGLQAQLDNCEKQKIDQEKTIKKKDVRNTVNKVFYAIIGVAVGGGTTYLIYK
jgi:LysM repeat protein